MGSQPSGGEAVVVVGAGQAGVQAAASLREGGFGGPIHLLGEEPQPPYQRPPLSKAFLLGDMSRERLELKPPEFFASQNIDLRVGERVLAIERDARRVRLASGGALGYRALVLATGARPLRLSAPGAHLDGVLMLRTLSDAERLKARLAEANRVAVIGGGYIGLETAAAARTLGCHAIVLEAADRLLARVAGPELARFLAGLHRDKGVEVRLNAKVTGFVGRDRLRGLMLGDGSEIDCDLAVVGVGVAPNEELAHAAGLACVNGVVTDAAGRTSDPAIFAIGDAARSWSALYGQAIRLESVQNAVDGAKAAAAAILGQPAPPAPAPWNWSDQYEVKLQMAGVGDGADARVVRGDPERGAFAVFAFLQGRLIACDAVNAPQEFVAARQMIARGARPDPRALADAGTNLKELMAAS